MERSTKAERETMATKMELEGKAKALSVMKRELDESRDQLFMAKEEIKELKHVPEKIRVDASRARRLSEEISREATREKLVAEKVAVTASQKAAEAEQSIKEAERAKADAIEAKDEATVTKKKAERALLTAADRQKDAERIMTEALRVRASADAAERDARRMKTEAEEVVAKALRGKADEEAARERKAELALVPGLDENGKIINPKEVQLKIDEAVTKAVEEARAEERAIAAKLVEDAVAAVRAECISSPDKSSPQRSRTNLHRSHTMSTVGGIAKAVSFSLSSKGRSDQPPVSPTPSDHSLPDPSPSPKMRLLGSLFSSPQASPPRSMAKSSSSLLGSKSVGRRSAKKSARASLDMAFFRKESKSTTPS
eukprot:TRINITY_DN1278_c0_g1_i2.p1 TRINITY_DN1278_c0_g1~~TRINITY_DN1278_c0_g1_i2.p1  ORF type:complete len:370 (+),score=76.88 TRINITY_DN1278_c0_g1_i2:268-1377(+)